MPGLFRRGQEQVRRQRVGSASSPSLFTICPEQGFVLLSSLPVCLITSLALLKVLLTH